jgi:hypothetical protein
MPRAAVGLHAGRLPNDPNQQDLNRRNRRTSTETAMFISIHALCFAALSLVMSTITSGNERRAMGRRVMADLSKRSKTQDSCLDAIAAACAEFVVACKALLDPYRPERHYMRGPGPRWRAKHSAA